MCLTFFFGRRGSSNKFIILGLEIETCWTLAAFSVSGIEKSGAAASSSSSSSNPPQKHISRPPLFSLPPSCLSLPRSPPQICVLTSQGRGRKSYSDIGFLPYFLIRTVIYRSSNSEPRYFGRDELFASI